jgi:hypothetical protein
VLTKVKEIRKRVKHSLFLNAGDEFQGVIIRAVVFFKSVADCGPMMYRPSSTWVLILFVR